MKSSAVRVFNYKFACFFCGWVLDKCTRVLIEKQKVNNPSSILRIHIRLWCTAGPIGRCRTSMLLLREVICDPGAVFHLLASFSASENTRTSSFTRLLCTQLAAEYLSLPIYSSATFVCSSSTSLIILAYISSYFFSCFRIWVGITYFGRVTLLITVWLKILPIGYAFWLMRLPVCLRADEWLCYTATDSHRSDELQKGTQAEGLLAESIYCNGWEIRYDQFDCGCYSWNFDERTFLIDVVLHWGNGSQADIASCETCAKIVSIRPLQDDTTFWLVEERHLFAPASLIWGVLVL